MAFAPSGSVVEEKENVKVLRLSPQLFSIEVFRIPQESMFSQMLVIILSEKIVRIWVFDVLA